MPDLALGLIFSFTGAPPTAVYTLSLHDALPISGVGGGRRARAAAQVADRRLRDDRDDHGGARYEHRERDRKSTRLNSSHLVISYAVFCLKKKKDSTKRVTPGVVRTMTHRCRQAT